MKKFLLTAVLLVFAATTFFLAQPALADGASLFGANCNACHIGGGNAINPAKTLKKSDLEKYGMFDLEAIKTQITNGKMAMPSFSGRLNEEQITEIAEYVLEKAEAGW